MTVEEQIPIRIGEPSDLDDMMDIAMHASDENGFVPKSTYKMLREIYSALHLDNGMMGIIGIPGSSSEGAVLLRIGEMWYSDSPVLEEKAIFVRPEFRAAKGGRARRLCKFSKWVADSMELPLIIGVLSDQRTQGKVRMYEREFGHASGAFFLHNAHTGAEIVNEAH